ncbi:MAG: dUTP diphosphatase [Rhodospirillaceae bacterium]|nr:dUTP diphosphatase [Rhodospirillaceae bacterium]
MPAGATPWPACAGPTAARGGARLLHPSEAGAGGAPVLKVRRLSAAAVLPAYAHPGDAGLDLCAAEACRLRPGERRLVRTGLAVELPPGTEGQVRPRSGLALRHGITVLNAPGTIDAGYRGEVCVLLANLGEAEVGIEPGMRIAQLVVAPVLRVAVEEVPVLSPSPRGAGGFGSTGA